MWTYINIQILYLNTMIVNGVHLQFGHWRMIGLEKISRIADIIVIIIQDNMVRDNVIRQCRCMGVEYDMLTLFFEYYPIRWFLVSLYTQIIVFYFNI